MGKAIRVLCLIALLFGSRVALAADFDDLFGDDLFLELEEQESVIRPEEALLVQNGWDFGANYNLTLNASRIFPSSGSSRDSFRAALHSGFYLDIRPNPDFRVFSKAGLNYTVSDLSVKDPLKGSLTELFADFHYANKVFFRAGKQNVSWGVGYFFSPADVINIGRIDPLDPGAEREGPVALKIHYPRSSNNYYTYLVFDDLRKPAEIAVAPKLELVMTKTELGLGGFFQRDKAPRLMLTYSSSLGNVALFGEAVASYLTGHRHLEPKGPFYEIKKKDGLFFQATAGGMYSYKNDSGSLNLTTAAQYFFNGEGQKEGEGLKKIRLSLLKGAIPPVLNPLELSALDVMGSGRHYLALSLSWQKILRSKYSASVFVQSNLSDRSGMVQGVLSLPPWGDISPRLGVSFNFGEQGSEFGLLGRNTTVFAAISLGGGSF